VAGLVLAGLAGLWILVRLPRAWLRVGRFDRTLAAGLVATLLGFATLSLIWPTVQVPAVAVALSLHAGLWNRWLSGATDLFAERGFAPHPDLA
jgi:hypothetical protein